jgi:hypothetical protein
MVFTIFLIEGAGLERPRKTFGTLEDARLYLDQMRSEAVTLNKSIRMVVRNSSGGYCAHIGDPAPKRQGSSR